VDALLLEQELLEDASPKVPWAVSLPSRRRAPMSARSPRESPTSCAPGHKRGVAVCVFGFDAERR